MNIKQSLSIAPIAVFLLLSSSCKKNRIPVNDAVISYSYNDELHYYDFNTIILEHVTLRKSVIYNQDIPHYYYLATFPFASDKTKGAMSLFLYNDTLYPGQEFREGNWNDPYEEYWQTYFTSNSLTAMIPLPGGTRYDAPYFYADRSFVFTIDDVVNGKASGRFEGYLFFYDNNIKTDSIELKQGVFRNIPVLDL